MAKTGRSNLFPKRKYGNIIREQTQILKRGDKEKKGLGYDKGIFFR